MNTERPLLLMIALLGCLLLVAPAGAQDEEGQEAEPADEEVGEEPADEEPAEEEPADEEPAEEEPADEEPADGGDLEWDEADVPTMGDDDDDDMPTMGDDDDDDSASGDEGEGEGEEDEGADGPDAGQHAGDEDDIDDWGGEIERQDLNQVIEREEVRVDVDAEPERIGVSGNWYQVGGDCLYCDTVLGQNLDVQEADVMRQFFDHLQIEPGAADGKIIYPSEGINRPVTITKEGDRLIVYMYTIDEGERTTPLYCTVWDLQWVLSDKKLLYGRRYSVDAYQLFAFGTWEKGYKADETYVPIPQLRTFLDLDMVAGLDETHKTFPVGEKAVLTYLGSEAFVRSDFVEGPYEELQNELFKEEVRRKELNEERTSSLDRGIQAFEEEDYENSQRLLLRAGELGEDSLDYWFYLGASYQGNKQYEEAIEAYRKVLGKDPQDTVTRYNLARILEKMGRKREALKEYQVIMKHDPDDDEVRDRAFDLAMELQEMQG
jgi:hypothetical protein